MKKLFKISLFGYSRQQVNAHVLSLRKDYETELSKRKDRMWEVSAENRELKTEISGYKERLAKYGEQELFISKAMVKAEESAQAMLKDCYRKIDIEKSKIKDEKEKWKVRENEIINQLLDLQNKIYDIMESFQSELNYLASKRVMMPRDQEDKTVTEANKPFFNVGSK